MSSSQDLMPDENRGYNIDDTIKEWASKQRWFDLSKAHEEFPHVKKKDLLKIVRRLEKEGHIEHGTATNIWSPASPKVERPRVPQHTKLRPKLRVELRQWVRGWKTFTLEQAHYHFPRDREVHILKTLGKLEDERRVRRAEPYGTMWMVNPPHAPGALKSKEGPPYAQPRGSDE